MAYYTAMDFPMNFICIISYLKKHESLINLPYISLFKDQILQNIILQADKKNIIIFL